MHKTLSLKELEEYREWLQRTILIEAVQPIIRKVGGPIIKICPNCGSCTTSDFCDRCEGDLYD